MLPLRNLKRILKAKGMTQKQLADMVGVSESMISQYVSGAKSPSFEMSFKIAEVLDCESADLVTEREGLLNLIDDEGKKIPATNSDGLTAKQIEFRELLPFLPDDVVSDMMAYAKVRLAQSKSQDDQE